MTAAAKLDAIEAREAIFAAAGYRCEVCGGPVRQHGTEQLAHRIPQTKANLAKYGAEIIHHRLNMAPTCSLKCNAAVLIGNNPVERKKLIDEIIRALAGKGE